jgi:hypothetical protein
MTSFRLRPAYLCGPSKLASASTRGFVRSVGKTARQAEQETGYQQWRERTTNALLNPDRFTSHPPSFLI